MNEPVPLLDQYSTTPTYSEELGSNRLPHQEKYCAYASPFFAYQMHDKTYGVVQGCCNHWNCPRCGIIRAKQEYWRIINGTKTLSENHQIWFITVTCRGKTLSREEADRGYGKWTNRLLDTWRLQAKRTHQEWSYVQVTERQKRGHPHSHFLTTFCPTDCAVDWKWQRVHVGGGEFRMAYVSALRSDYIERTCRNAGLGEEYDITLARTVDGVSRYVAKYLFKDSIFNTIWPKGWKRVRYSQSFPKLDGEKTDAFVLIHQDDWRRLSRLAVVVKATDQASAYEANLWLKGSDTIVLTK